MFDAINDFVEKMSGSSDYTAALTTLLVLIIILIIYLVVFKLGMMIISYMMDWKGDPYILRGMEDMEDTDKHYFTNPLDYENEPLRVILRSENEQNGVEFTWGTWLYIDANKMISRTVNNDSGSGVTCSNGAWGDRYKIYSIFNKGSHVQSVSGEHLSHFDDNNTAVGGVAVMTCPGLYVKYSKASDSYIKERYRKELAKIAGTNKEYDKIDVVDGPNIERDDKDNEDVMRNRFEYVITCNTMNENELMETVTIPDIPLNLWTYVVIRCMNYKLDVYINGRIKKRVILSGLPRQNYGDLYVCEKGAHGILEGKISNLRYFNYALQARTIEYFTEKGPNLDPPKKPKNEKDGEPYYLTQRWHYTDYLR